MRLSRIFASFFAVLGLLVMASGCESLGERRGAPANVPSLDPFSSMDEKPAEPGTKPVAKKTNWSPGAWSSEAQDIEKNMMRNNADPNW